MSINRSLLIGSTTTVVLKLLEEKDMYGYQTIEVLAQKSDDTFNLKAGTLYPILHSLENSGVVESYKEEAANGRKRKYYHLTPKGKKLLQEKHREWVAYSSAIDRILEGGLSYATV